MKNDQLPEGFLATREGGTVRVHLPEVVVTAAHVLEPLLTRGAAQRLAEALWEADVDATIERVVLLRDPRLPAEAVLKFRQRLLGLFLDGGIDAAIDIELEATAEGEGTAALPATQAAAAPPPGVRPAPPARDSLLQDPPAQDSLVADPPAASPLARKPFVAPVPARRREAGP